MSPEELRDAMHRLHDTPDAMGMPKGVRARLLVVAAEDKKQAETLIASPTSPAPPIGRPMLEVVVDPLLLPGHWRLVAENEPLRIGYERLRTERLIIG